MKNKIKLHFVFAFLVTIVLTSCSNNESDIEDLEQEELSELVLQDFSESVNSLAVPAALSSSDNAFARQTNLQFNSVKSIGLAFATFFNVPANALQSKSSYPKKSTSSNTQTYTWSQDGIAIKYTITETSDRYSFTYNITSPDFTGNFMNGYQLKDGSYAEIVINETNDQEAGKITWSVTDNTQTLTVDFVDAKLELKSNTSDNSGSLRVFEDNTLVGLYEWNADGSGKFTDFIENETYTW